METNLYYGPDDLMLGAMFVAVYIFLFRLNLNFYPYPSELKICLSLYMARVHSDQKFKQNWTFQYYK
jgi:hypothetical protein